MAEVAIRRLPSEIRSEILMFVPFLVLLSASPLLPPPNPLDGQPVHFYSVDSGTLQLIKSDTLRWIHLKSLFEEKKNDQKSKSTSTASTGRVSDLVNLEEYWSYGIPGNHGNAESQPLFICRVYLYGRYLPGRVDGKECRISALDQSLRDFQLLVSPSLSSNTAWVPWFSGDPIPEGALTVAKDAIVARKAELYSMDSASSPSFVVGRFSPSRGEAEILMRSTKTRLWTSDIELLIEIQPLRYSIHNPIFHMENGTVQIQSLKTHLLADSLVVNPLSAVSPVHIAIPYYFESSILVTGIPGMKSQVETVFDAGNPLRLSNGRDIFLRNIIAGPFPWGENSTKNSSNVATAYLEAEWEPPTAPPSMAPELPAVDGDSPTTSWFSSSGTGRRPSLRGIMSPPNNSSESPSMSSSTSAIRSAAGWLRGRNAGMEGSPRPPLILLLMLFVLGPDWSAPHANILTLTPVSNSTEPNWLTSPSSGTVVLSAPRISEPFSDLQPTPINPLETTPSAEVDVTVPPTSSLPPTPATDFEEVVPEVQLESPASSASDVEESEMIVRDKRQSDMVRLLTSFSADVMTPYPAFEVGPEFRQTLGESPTATPGPEPAQVALLKTIQNMRHRRETGKLWDCEKRQMWVDLGDNHFPRYLRTMECVQKSCFYGSFRCVPRAFTVKKPEVSSTSEIPSTTAEDDRQHVPEELREKWVWEELGVTFCCDCTNVN
ncbi:unnamed protein product [Cyprideis torosa]|uniref:Uncharacterized protein n=1 Tax=Cyprideis torosa TaxID=163714 RepID=A0A7R8W0L6_9CRUS|nr:unnamed protein product [Cyprideis torosa]CAG0879693.1 unnamed protein product [Cyprideis torosa]